MPVNAFSFVTGFQIWGLMFMVLFTGSGLFARPSAPVKCEALRKELGIPSNEILARQSDQEFLRMLHLDSLIWIQDIKFKNQIPVLLEELSSFSMEQDKEVKLRIRMLMFWLNCILSHKNSVFFDELVKEAVDLRQKNLHVNLIYMNAVFSDFSDLSQLIKNFWQLREAADILDGEPNLFFSNKARILYYVGDSYYHLGDYLNASRYIQRSLLHCSGNQSIPHLNLMGYLFRLNKLPDSSDLYFQRTLDLARGRRDSAYIGIASGNLGENFYLRKQYEPAIPLLETDALIALKQKDYGLASNALLLLSEIYLRKGDKEKAGILLSLGRANAFLSVQYTGYKRLKLLYATSARYFALMNQPEKAIQYLDSFRVVTDSLAHQASNLAMMNPELMYQDKKARLIQVQQKAENEAKQQRINALIVTLVLLLIIVGLIFWLFRLRSRLQVNRLLLDRQNMEKNVSDAKEELNRMSDNLAESSRHISELKDSKIEKAGQELREIKKITDAQWASFHNLFEQAHPQFLLRLKARFPMLTSSEIRFVMLVRMQIKDAKMTEMLGVGPEAIRQNRFRIRRKIAVTEDGNYEDIILSI